MFLFNDQQRKDQQFTIVLKEKLRATKEVRKKLIFSLTLELLQGERIVKLDTGAFDDHIRCLLKQRKPNEMNTLISSWFLAAAEKKVFTIRCNKNVSQLTVRWAYAPLKPHRPQLTWVDVKKSIGCILATQVMPFKGIQIWLWGCSRSQCKAPRSWRSTEITHWCSMEKSN